jgi:polysaccharide deacetylase 2 family uncharacterized protein YibQ
LSLREQFMRTRWISGLTVFLVALLATAGGSLLGWGVMRLKGGAAAFTQPPPSLALVRAVPQTNRDAPDGLEAFRPKRMRVQGANAPERKGVEGARLAIVIDDIGQTLSAPRDLLALGVPITFSVLPGLPHSREAAGLIVRARQEYLIHLPMEPVDYPAHDPGPWPLLLSLDATQTRQRIEGYLRDLPDAVGASNHMGSAYTADADGMAVVQRVLAERRLFFLNSKTSPSPVPARVARQGGYAYLERDVFLDNDRDERSIARALDQALARARRHGQAIAVGHPYPETLQVLRNAIASDLLRGVELAPLAELLGR